MPALSPLKSGCAPSHPGKLPFLHNQGPQRPQDQLAEGFWGQQLLLTGSEQKRIFLDCNIQYAF